jgi:hypothetical protein
MRGFPPLMRVERAVDRGVDGVGRRQLDPADDGKGHEDRAIRARATRNEPSELVGGQHVE